MVETPEQLITNHQLKKAHRVLFMTHLAIGDYVYQRTFLEAVLRKYTSMTLDIWIDDCRDSHKPWHGGRNTVLTQWLESEEMFGKVYPIASDEAHRQRLIEQASERQYDIIIFVATQRTERFAEVARDINEHAFIVGSRSNLLTRLFNNSKQLRKLNGSFNIDAFKKDRFTKHISDFYRKCYELCFGRLFGSDGQIPPSPIYVPEKHEQKAYEQVIEFAQHYDVAQPYTLFINHLSTTPKRDWSMSKVIKLISKLREKHPNLMVVVNAPPDRYDAVCTELNADDQLKGLPVMAFTANTHFYELPAMIHACDLVLSVETAVMHLASALKKPLVCLMRKKAQQWEPVNADHVVYSKQNVDDIVIEDVLDEIDGLIRKSVNSRN